MADGDGNGWPDIEPLPKLPSPPKPPPTSVPSAPSVPAGPPTAPPLPPAVAPAPPWPPRPPGPAPSNSIAWWITGMLALVMVLLVAAGVAATSGSDDDDPGERVSPTDVEDDDDVESVSREPDTTTPTTDPPTPTTASTEPPPPPPPPGPGFDSGLTLIVGQDIQPGLYTNTGGFTCYWERRHSVDNGLDGVIVNGNAEGHVLEILASDEAFTSSTGCDRWLLYAPPPEPAATFGDGDWVVGEQIAAGTYRVDNPSGLCFWERASGFTHDFDEFITYSFEVSAGDTVQVQPGERFTAAMCGTWVPA